MKKLYKFILPFLLFVLIPNVKAADVTFQISGGSVYIGNSTNITVRMNSNVGNIITFEGEFGVSDSSCLKINSINSSFGTNGNRIAAVDGSGRGWGSGTTIATINVTGLKNCTGRVTMNGVLAGTLSGGVSAVASSSNISVTTPPSSNNNSASLTVSVGGLNPGFSQANTNYSVSVDSNVTSIDIGASPADGGARVEGTGNKGLNYGNNAFGIKVTAPSGAVKTYTITVNRKDNRSGNNNLASLSINGASLDQPFDPNNTNYSAKVPFEIETASINANPADGKAKVSVSGNSGLISEETSNVSVTVIAENGASKTYTIAVTRGKDPNKVLSTDNHLRKLEPSIGILSPVFDPEKENYVIYLPYEVDTISFNAKVSDSRYGILNVDAPDKLVPGIANVFKFSVTAEDESVKVYTVVVKRAINPETETSSNTYLESIKLSNGELLYTNGKVVTDFNKEIKKYFYKKNNDFTYEVTPEDPNAAVTTVKDGSSIQFIVEAPNGEFSIYTLDLYGSYSNIFMNILLFILGMVCGIGAKELYKKYKDNKSSKPKEEKVKKDKKKKDDK